MAIVTRRYLFQGPPLQAIQSETDPGLTLSTPQFVLVYDVTFDTAIADIAAVDESMGRRGFVPDSGADTSVEPDIELVAPNATRWKLVVDNLGVLSTIQVT